jgi:hypothetical protein
MRTVCDLQRIYRNQHMFIQVLFSVSLNIKKYKKVDQGCGNLNEKR